MELDKRLVRCCLRKGGTLHFGERCESAKEGGVEGDFPKNFTNSSGNPWRWKVGN